MRPKRKLPETLNEIPEIFTVENWFTQIMFAKHLGISKVRVHALVKNGRINTVKFLEQKVIILK